ncbi:TonB-dependent receptor [Echinicola sediminis]
MITALKIFNKPLLYLGVGAALNLSLGASLTPANASVLPLSSVEEVPYQKEVKGMVSNEFGEPLMGVAVLVKGTSVGVVTDLDGNFNLNNVPDDAESLIFSFIGMKTLELPIQTNGDMKVVMEEDVFSIEEQVVIGYGTTRKSDLTGAVSSVNSKDFEKQPVTRVEDALQGRAAGVQVIKGSGVPGSDVQIRIRGANSINGNNQPLVVIDGVIGADLRSINTNDIASMEVLKDASATAIYGSRGANGVILVTTKRGDGKAKVDLSAFTSVSSVANKIDILSPEEFGSIHNLPVINGGTDCQEEYFQQGVANNVQLSVSGKNDKVGYFISGNVLDQSGIALNSDYSRYSLRANIDTEITDKFSVQLNMYGSSEKTLNLVDGGSSSSPDERAGIVAVLGWDPTLPLRDENGNYNLLSTNGSGLINPIAQRLESQAQSTIGTVNTNLNLSYQFNDNLKLTVLGGLIHRNVLGESYYGVPAGTVLSPPTGGGSIRQNTTLQNSNILTWDKSFNDHNLKLTGLFEFQQFVNKGFNASAGQYSIPANFYSLDLGTNQRVNATYSKSQIVSYMGRAEYNYLRKLFVTATLRTDISSRFRPENQVGVFPSGSVAYQFENVAGEVIETLKLRAGYGETGNQAIAPYSTYNTLNTGQDYPINGTSIASGLVLGPLANPDLTWETTKQSNIGADLTFLYGKFNLSINKYWKNTVDLLLAVPIPGFVGGGSITRNVGEVFNGGWEFNLQTHLVNTPKFQWDVNTNYFFNTNEIKSLTSEQHQILISPVGGVSNTTGAYVLLREGMPMGQFYGATFLGTYKTGETGGTPGDAKYLEDENGDVVLDVIGNGTPKHNWAINNTMTWGNFDLNFLIRGVHGFDVMNFTRAKISMGGGVQSLPTYGEYRNRWTAENETEVPVSGNLLINSTRFMEKGDFVRLSNLSLGYTLNNTNLFRSFRIYASAQNLFTITDYSGYDPEASSIGAGSGAASSIDYGANPNARTYTFGVNIGF